MYKFIDEIMSSEIIIFTFLFIPQIFIYWKKNLAINPDRTIWNLVYVY